MDLLLTRDELTALTGTKQPKRMCDWLSERNWVFVEPCRRGDIPKVARAYCDARLTGRPLTESSPRVGPRFDLLAQA